MEYVNIRGQLEYKNVHGFNIKLTKHFFEFSLLIGWNSVDELLQSRLRNDLSRFAKRFGKAIYLPSICEVDVLLLMDKGGTWENLLTVLNEELGVPKTSLNEMLESMERRDKFPGYYIEYF
ncbi:hypothetical protein DNH61_05485 [Paenibacillus sambharensis]|uniref:Uncharacterized protein n=1 Tax=Paenibacillus sambharensis TaxID=1803190 RepID=A0A2W1LYS5_9BACL|nr:hypothetical protein [Paenibacillus sambharensis]PZD96657.1 hypothetical protein DNH61_05485 [Paenibacillus sambharensis]